VDTKRREELLGLTAEGQQLLQEERATPELVVRFTVEETAMLKTLANHWGVGLDIAVERIVRGWLNAGTPHVESPQSEWWAGHINLTMANMATDLKA